jgi:hypothetical protein
VSGTGTDAHRDKHSSKRAAGAGTEPPGKSHGGRNAIGPRRRVKPESGTLNRDRDGYDATGVEGLRARSGESRARSRPSSFRVGRVRPLGKSRGARPGRVSPRAQESAAAVNVFDAAGVTDHFDGEN